MAKYCDEWPQVAEVMAIEGERLTLKWFTGAKTTPWKPCNLRNDEPWLETVSKSVVWYRGFSLTPSNHLPKKVQLAAEEYKDNL